MSLLKDIHVDLLRSNFSHLISQKVYFWAKVGITVQNAVEQVQCTCASHRQEDQPTAEGRPDLERRHPSYSCRSCRRS